MNAIIAVIGEDRTGILAKISTICAETNANIMDVTQTVMQNYFGMIMLVDITDLGCDFITFSRDIHDAGKSIGMVVHVMHEEIFNSMHRV
jgi:ACT domain-containing protein